jgi:hypothetical protein
VRLERVLDGSVNLVVADKKGALTGRLGNWEDPRGASISYGLPFSDTMTTLPDAVLTHVRGVRDERTHGFDG